MFRNALRKHQCLVPADGLYECLKKEKMRFRVQAGRWVAALCG
jgi:putative SOS response-associated peptidase YedK